MTKELIRPIDPIDIRLLKRELKGQPTMVISKKDEIPDHWPSKLKTDIKDVLQEGAFAIGYEEGEIKYAMLPYNKATTKFPTREQIANIVGPVGNQPKNTEPEKPFQLDTEEYQKQLNKIVPERDTFNP